MDKNNKYVKKELNIDEIYKFYKINDNDYKNKLTEVYKNIKYDEIQDILNTVYYGDYKSIKKLWDINYEELFENEYISNIIILYGYHIHLQNVRAGLIKNEQIDITINRVRDCIYSNNGGTIRVSQMLWATYFIKGKIIEIGNLQFEISDYDEYNQIFTSCIHLHVPKNVDFNFNKIIGSIECFKKNGDYYFNAYKEETHNILCSSWLLSAEVLKCLDDKSNIRKFSELFHIKKGKNAEKDCIKYIFNNIDISSLDINNLNNLQIKVKQLIEKNITINRGIGLLK